VKIGKCYGEGLLGYGDDEVSCVWEERGRREPVVCLVKFAG